MDVYLLFVGGGGLSLKKTTGYIYVTVTSEICKISLEMQVWKYCNSLISVYSPMLHKCSFWLSFERVKYFICKQISKVVLLVIFKYAGTCAKNILCTPP